MNTGIDFCFFLMKPFIQENFGGERSNLQPYPNEKKSGEQSAGPSKALLQLQHKLFKKMSMGKYLEM